MAFHDLHIENSWSLAIWLKPGRDTADETVLDLRADGTNENRIRVEKLGTVANDPLQISLYDSAGVLFKQYRYNSVVPAGAWAFPVFTWNGTTLTAYVDGAAVTASSTPTNNAGTMDAVFRSVTVGVDYAHTAYYQGYVHAIGLWSSVLAALEVAELNDTPPLWWRRDEEDYTSATDLQHWWRLGEATRNDFEGTSWVVDAGYAVEGIDLSVGAVGVTDADIVAEVPTYSLVSLGSLSMFSASTYLMNSTQQDIGIANAWSISMSFLRDNTSMGGAAGCYLDIKETTGNENRIQIGNSPSGSSRINITLYDSAGVKFKDYGYSLINNGNGDYWINVALSWDGTDLTAAFNGLVLAQDVTTTNIAGTMTNTNRGISLGATALAVEGNILLHTCAIWDVVLADAELEQVSEDQGNNDLSNDYGAYASSADLIHYFRGGLAAVTPQSGDDYIVDYLPIAGIDMSANAVGLDATDNTTDFPYHPAYTAHALDFDGSSYVLSNGDVVVGITQEWTIKFTVYSDRDTHDETIMEVKAAASNNNRVLVQKLGTVANNPLRILVNTSAGAAFKDYQWDSVIPAGTWQTFTLVFSDAGNTMVLYDEGGNVLTPSTLTTDATGVISAINRTIAFGASIDGSNPFDGRIRQAAFLGDNHSAAAVAAMGGHNFHLCHAATDWALLSTTVGSINHWILFGLPSPESFQLTNPSDFMREANATGIAAHDWSASVNMSAADITEEIAF